MNVLRTYLWKEWRDQRVQVLGFALLVPFLLTVALVSIPGNWSRADAMPTLIAAGGLLIATLTIASDLVPGELRRGRFEFLARMPGDLRAAFAAKLLFCIGALALFCVYGWLCATVLSASIGGGKWFVPFEWKFTDRISTATGSHELRWSLLEPLVAFAAWTFAVSCWLPRGTLALPASLLALSLIGAPPAIALLQHPGMPTHAQDIQWASGWLLATALLAAALSFLRGARHGRRPLRVVGWALIGTLVAAAPVWAWTASRWLDYTNLDLTSDSLAIQPVALGDGGRFVFANVRPTVLRFGAWEDQANHAVVIDLEDGTARAVGGVDSRFELPWRQASVGTTPLVLFRHDAEAGRARPHRAGPFDWDDVLDSRSGRSMSGDAWSSLLHDVSSIESSVERACGSVWMPDGSRCWMTGTTLHVEARTGAVTTQEFSAAPRRFFEGWRPCGAGFAGSGGYVDLAAREFVPHDMVQAITSRALDGSGTAWVGRVLSIRADGWLLAVDRGSRDGERAIVFWSPGESGVRPVPGLAALDEVAGTYVDGRVLVARRSDPHLRTRRVDLAVLDPGTGIRVDVAMPAGAVAPDAVSWNLGSFASGAVVLGLQWHDDPGGPNYCVAPTRFARISGDGRAQFTALLPGVEFGAVIGCPDESTLLVLRDGRQVVRAKFDGSSGEVAFPRASAATRTSTGSGTVGVPK